MQQQGKCLQFYEKYRIQCQIGRGTSGICYKVQQIKSKQIFVMKKIHITSIKKGNPKQACSEVQILSKLNHPNIIKLHQSFTDQNNIYIVMQYASKGDLHHILKRRKILKDYFTENQIWEMSHQLLTALEYLHNRNIIHRDVKTLNIFMDMQAKLYLGDLGVSKILKTDSGLYSRVGTPLYLAPEIIKYEKYDFKADIWGLGCVCYHLTSLNHPFQGKNIITLGQNIVGMTPKKIDNYSNELNCFILQMLEKNPKQRLNADELLKKYFINKPSKQIIQISTTPLIKHDEKLKIETKQKEPKIHGGRAFFEFRPTQMKNKLVSNYTIDERLKYNFGDTDKIKQNIKSYQKQKIEEDLDQTIILVKKTNPKGQIKNYIEATRKQSISFQPQASNVQDRQQSKMIKDEIKNNIISFRSETKFMPVFTGLINSPKKNAGQSSSSLQKYVNQKTEISCTDINRLPSQSQIKVPTCRIRPKSSIMSKERHESTMKNIRKTMKTELSGLSKFVETAFLKRPEMIIL